MGRRGRTGKIQAQSLNPTSELPSETETPVSAEEMNSIDIDTEVKEVKMRSPRKKAARTPTVVIRRSKRLKSPAQVNCVEPVAEDMLNTQVEMEHELPTNGNHSHEETPDPAMQPSPAVTTSGRLNYRSLYIGSHKKVTSLMKKNRQLKRKLKYALGKIEVYAEMTPVLSSLTKANEILCKRQCCTKRLRT